jgi:hypothetical protein
VTSNPAAAYPAPFRKHRKETCHGKRIIIMKAIRKVFQLRVESQLSIRQINTLTQALQPVIANYLEPFPRTRLTWEDFSWLSD